MERQKIKRKIAVSALMAIFLLSLAACAGQNGAQENQNNTVAENTIAEQSAAEPQSEEAAQEEEQQGAQQEDAVQENTQEDGTESPRILTAYFTRLDNTDATLDEIVQGGGPYGGLGSSMEDADMDAIASASITMVDGEAMGNVEMMAETIQSVVGGDLFSIQTVEKYPVDYDELIDLGGEEKSQNARPELASHVENMDEYDIVFLGYPNWWYDMPMAVYSFLEEYDFSGKTVIPFAASAGSGFSGTIDTIQEMLPDTEVIGDGLHIQMEEVAGGREQIEEWVSGLSILQSEE